MEQTKSYAVRVSDVFSGDDLMVMVDLGVDDLWKRKRIRLHGVDTPNAVHAADDTEAGRVRRLVRGIAGNRTGTINLRSRGSGSWVVELIINTPDGPLNLNEYLINQGFQFKRKV